MAIAVLGLASIWVLQRLAAPAGDGAFAPLKLYCAAGMRDPIEEIVGLYQQEYGVPVEVQFGGSQTLLGQLQIHRTEGADLFLAADAFYAERAVQLGLSEAVIPIAYTRPVLVVPRSNPRGLTPLADLLQPGVRISLADPDQAAIGKAIRDRLRTVPHGDGTLWDALERQVREHGVFKPTVTDSATDIKLAAVDAGFLWDSTLAMPAYREALTALPAPELSGDPDLLAICVLKSSRQPGEAERFARYVTGRDRGLPVFRRFGVQPVDDLAAEESPPADGIQP